MGGNLNITLDLTPWRKGFTRLSKGIDDNSKKAVKKIANEVLRLSQFEVPHDTGALQNSGHTESSGEFEESVGYNKVYAARLHEHPEYSFQGGRKGKYLEDPIKHNLRAFKEIYKQIVGGFLG